jgi:hypothetical protein
VAYFHVLGQQDDRQPRVLPPQLSGELRTVVVVPA